ncbi:unnamed protein product [Closterium sp. NIES-65]|nr:unnamed protein product [Closterium sp. NIES-65]
MPTLQFLNLSSNRLRGSLPESLTTMSNLVTLSVAFNYMEGTIPPALGKLRNLSTLDTNTSGLKCPDSYSSCGVPQNTTSGFCRTCPDFCSTSTTHVWRASQPLQQAARTFSIWIQESKAATLFTLEGMGVDEKNLPFTLHRIRCLPAPLYRVCSALLLPTALVSSKAAAQHHPNLVRLLGFAIGITDKRRVEQILIYELMPNGDLSRWIGKGEHFNSCAHALLRGDSFGILMLELITGRHVITNSFETHSDEEAGQQLHILRWVQQQLGQLGNRAVVAGLKDARMEAWDDLVLRVVDLALRCTAKHSAMRPAMGVIAAELETVLVALGGERRNSAARQVDQQVEEERMADLDLDAEIARLNGLIHDN